MKALRLVLITSLCIFMALGAKAQVKIGENPLNTSPSHWLEIEQADSFFIVTDDLSIGISDNPHRGSAPAPNVDALMLKLYGYGLNNFFPSATSPFIQDSEPLGGITSNIFAGITEDGYLMEVPLKLVIEVADSSQADLSFFNGVDTFGTADLMALDTIFATDNELRDSTALLRTLINNSEMADHDTITGNEFIDSIRLSNDTLFFIENLAGRLAPTNTQSIDLGPLINGSTFYLADGALDESRTVDGATFDLTYTNINDLLESSATNTTTTTGDLVMTSGDSIGITATNNISVESSAGDISIDAFRDATLSSTSQTTINGNQIAIQQGGDDIMQINSNHETKFLSPTVDTILLLDDDGSISMEAYGDSSITGDVSQILAVDSDGNMIEIGIVDILASDADSTIYTHDGTLTGPRVLTGNTNDLTFTGVGTLTQSSTTSINTTSARNEIISTAGDVGITAANNVDITAGDELNLDAPVTTINDSLRLEGYGDTSYVGSFTTILGSDINGNVIEVTASEILGTETDSVIYRHDGTLTGDRVLDGAAGAYDLSFNQIDSLTESSRTSLSSTTGENIIESTAGNVKIEADNDVDITGNANILLSAEDEVTATSNNITLTTLINDIDLNANTDVIVNANDAVDLNAPVTTINDSLRLEGYGDTTYTGTFTTILGSDIDGNVIEIRADEILGTEADSVIYRHDGTLTGDRVLSGAGNDLTFAGLGALTDSSATSLSTTTGDNNIESTGGDVIVTASDTLDADGNVVTIDAVTTSTITSGFGTTIESTGGSVLLQADEGVHIDGINDGIYANGPEIYITSTDELVLTSTSGAVAATAAIAVDLNAPVTTINDSLRLEGYGDTTYTGTFTTILGSDIDGNVIEIRADEILGTEADSVIYRHDGTLTGDRVLDGAAGAYDLSFNQIDSLTESSRTSLSTTTGENTIQSTNGDVSIDADAAVNVDAANVNVNSTGGFTAVIDDVTTITSGSEVEITSNTSDVILDANTAVRLIAPVTTINDSLRLEGYGDTTYTGTFTTILGSDIDGNVIEIRADEILGTEADSVIYRHDGTLTGDRVLSGAGNDLTFAGLGALTDSSATSLSTTTGDNNIESTGGDVNILSTNNVNIEAYDTLYAYGLEVEISGEDGVLIQADNANVEITAAEDVEITAVEYVEITAYVLDLNATVTTINDSLRLEGYGDTSYVGSFTTILASDIDGNVIEVTASEILGTETDSVIYRHDGTLTGDRVLSGAGNDLTFTGVDSLINSSTTSFSTTTGDYTIESFDDAILFAIDTAHIDGENYVLIESDNQIEIITNDLVEIIADEVTIDGDAGDVIVTASESVDLNAPVTTINDSLRLEGYGDTSYVGSFTTILGSDIDGNVIEITADQILGTESDSTIYTHDGTLTAERTMTMGALATPRNLFFVSPDGTDTTVIASDGRVGISTGSFTPNSIQSDVKLEVNGDILAIKVHSSSDRRFKKNISPIASALEKVMSIDGVTYDFRKDEFINRNFPTGTQVGFIAQNVESVLPEVVITNGDGYKAVDYSKITALLNEAIKEQQAQITDLQERLKASSELNASLADEISAIKNMIKEFSHLADSDED